MTVIKDGLTGNTAKVGSDNKVHTRSVQTNSFQEALLDGRSFRLASGVQTLTSDTLSEIIYVKNNDTRDMFLEEVITTFGNSNVTGDILVGFKLNPPTGTIIDDAVGIFALNTNIGASSVADVAAYSGGEGKTADGIAGFSLFSEAGIYSNKSVAVIPHGSSFTLSVTPPAGNTSMNTQIVIRMFFIEEV